MNPDNSFQRPSESMRTRLVASLRNRLDTIVEALADPASKPDALAALEAEAAKLRELLASHNPEENHEERTS